MAQDEQHDERPWIEARRRPAADPQLEAEQARLSLARLSVAQSIGLSVLIALMVVGTVYVAYHVRQRAIVEPPRPVVQPHTETVTAPPAQTMPPGQPAAPPPAVTSPLTEVIRWQYDAGVFDINRPALGEDGSLFFCSGKLLTALANDGSLRWEFDPPGDYEPSAPTYNVDQNVITTAASTVYSVNGWGRLDWSEDLGYGRLSPPCTTSRGFVLVTGNSGKLACLYPRGGLAWDCAIGASARSGPVVGRDIYVVTQDGALQAVDLRGNPRWRVDNLPLADARQPVLSGDGTVYVTGYEPCAVYAVSPEGRLSWQYDLAERGYCNVSPCANGDIIVSGGTLTVTRLSSAGSVLWRIRRGCTDEHPLLQTRSGHILLSGLNENTLEILNPDGTHYLGLHLPLDSLNYAVEAPDGTVYACMFSGNIYAIRL